MAKKQKKADFYKLGTSNKDVKISVDVGLAQLGAVKISLDTKAIASAPAPIGLQNLGAGTTLNGKLLIVEVLVTDVSVMTNKMGVTIKLSGGTSSKTITASGEVAEPGESILFQTSILLKE